MQMDTVMQHQQQTGGYDLNSMMEKFKLSDFIGVLVSLAFKPGKMKREQKHEALFSELANNVIYSFNLHRLSTENLNLFKEILECVKPELELNCYLYFGYMASRGEKQNMIYVELGGSAINLDAAIILKQHPSSPVSNILLGNQPDEAMTKLKTRLEKIKAMQAQSPNATCSRNMYTFLESWFTEKSERSTGNDQTLIHSTGAKTINYVVEMLCLFGFDIYVNPPIPNDPHEDKHKTVVGARMEMILHNQIINCVEEGTPNPHISLALSYFEQNVVAHLSEKLEKFLNGLFTYYKCIKGINLRIIPGYAIYRMREDDEYVKAVFRNSFNVCDSNRTKTDPTIFRHHEFMYFMQLEKEQMRFIKEAFRRYGKFWVEVTKDARNHIFDMTAKMEGCDYIPSLLIIAN